MSKNNIEVKNAKEALTKMKLEIAEELGIANYETIDKGNLSAKQNGKIGGNMVKRMIKIAQENMIK